MNETSIADHLDARGITLRWDRARERYASPAGRVVVQWRDGIVGSGWCATVRGSGGEIVGMTRNHAGPQAAIDHLDRTMTARAARGDAPSMEQWR